MRRFTLGLICAVLLLVALPGTALMATVTQPLGASFGGLATCAFSYDDATKIILSFTLDNEDNATHTIRGELIDPVSLNTIAQHAFLMPAHSVQVLQVSALNVQMVDRVAKDGITHYLGLPVIIGCAFS